MSRRAVVRQVDAASLDHNRVWRVSTDFADPAASAFLIARAAPLH